MSLRARAINSWSTGDTATRTPASMKVAADSSANAESSQLGRRASTTESVKPDEAMALSWMDMNHHCAELPPNRLGPRQFQPPGGRIHWDPNLVSIVGEGC